MLQTTKTQHSKKRTRNHKHHINITKTLTMESPASVRSSSSAELDTQSTPPVTTIHRENTVEGVCDLSDITMNTNMTLREAKLHISLLQKKIEEVSEKNLLYKSHNNDLTSKLEMAHKHLERSKNITPVGKNLFAKRKRTNKKDHQEDTMNIVYVNELVTKIFQGYKFKPTSFQAWNPSEPGSVCHTIVSSGNIGWPDQFPRERYWNESIVPMINSKYCTLINNATQKMRDQFISTYDFQIL